MNPIRKATPDSEAVASSEDERPWPATSAFGTLPRKENSVPGFGGGIWAQKRGSMKMDKAARNNAANAVREGRLASAHSFSSGLRPGSTPSPAASEGSGALPFAIPLHPTPKAGRSLSHSHGQREFLTTRPSAGDHASVLPLDLLSEEVDTETDSEIGGPLAQTASQPPVKSFQRTTTFPNMYDAVRSPNENEELGNGLTSRIKPLKSDRGLDGSLNHNSAEQRQRRLWESSLGWEDLPGINESRRHSLAEIPTRRGSLSAVGSSNLGASGYWGAASDAFENTTELQGEFGEHSLFGADPTAARVNSIDAGSIKFGEQDEQAKANDVPAMYKVPFIEIADHERSEADRRASAGATSGSPFGQPGRPRKQLFIVSFKCSRVDVFYLLDNTGLFIKEGDIVIVEADRGQDLGTVQHANVSNDEARLYKRKYGEEQYKWLMMFSRNSTQGNINPNAQVYGENQGSRNNMLNSAPMAMQGVPRDSFNNLKPKAIKRLASSHEIRMLGEKEGNEAKAKRTCQQKVNHLHLDMEILDAEWQWDFQKLIFYYYADHYINFKDLITELYRIYKTRIWLSAINPASFSQHAHGQPPSGIGPGAITSFNAQGPNTAYTMAYGSDPDPYGAVPPYSIGYDTYTPNYPAIPGVANSFAPPMFPAVGNQATPALPPGVAATGSLEDYNFYYNRSAAVDETTAARSLQHQPNNSMNFNNQEEYFAAYRASTAAQAPGEPLDFGGVPAPLGPMGGHGAIGSRGPPPLNNTNNQGMGGGVDGGFAYAPMGPRRSFLQRTGGVDPSMPRPAGLFGGVDSAMRNAQSRSGGTGRIAPSDQAVHTYLQGLSLHGDEQTRVLPVQTRQQ